MMKEALVKSTYQGEEEPDQNRKDVGDENLKHNSRNGARQDEIRKPRGGTIGKEGDREVGGERKAMKNKISDFCEVARGGEVGKRQMTRFTGPNRV